MVNTTVKQIITASAQQNNFWSTGSATLVITLIYDPTTPSYVEKQMFLERADLRQFEQEKAIRDKTRKTLMK